MIYSNKPSNQNSNSNAVGINRINGKLIENCLLEMGENIIYRSKKGKLFKAILKKFRVKTKNDWSCIGEDDELKVELFVEISNGNNKFQFLVTFDNPLEIYERVRGVGKKDSTLGKLYLSRNIAIDQSTVKEKLVNETSTALYETVNSEGNGVSQEEIENRRYASTRFKNTWNNYLDVNKYGLDDKIERFFQGESLVELKNNKRNDLNNPLQLIRPKLLLSLQHFCYYFENNYQGTHQEIMDKKRRMYMYLIQKYENLSSYILESLNEPDDNIRMDNVFRYTYKFFTENKIVSIKTQSPQLWIFMIVLSILTNPSKGISATGRVRALKLLNNYDDKQILDYFRSTQDLKNQNGFDLSHIPLVPKKFRTEKEMENSSHGHIWKLNPNIRALIMIKDGKINLHGTIINILENHKDEAYQLAMLFLHDSVTSKIGLALIKAITYVSPNMQGRILSISNIDPIKKEPKINQKESLLGKTKKELIQLIVEMENTYQKTAQLVDMLENDLYELRKNWVNSDSHYYKLNGIKDKLELLLKELNDEIGDKDGQIKRFDSLLMDKEKTIGKLNQKIDSLTRQINNMQARGFGRNGGNVGYNKNDGQPWSENLNPLNNYHKILGLNDPNELKGLDPERILAILKTHLKAKMFLHHPDSTLNELEKQKQTEKFKRLQIAYETLKKHYQLAA